MKSRLEGDGKPWKFAFLSDTQGDRREIGDKCCINAIVLRSIALDIVEENPDFVIAAGDLVSGWFRNRGMDFALQYAHWREAMGPVYDRGIRVYPLRGNHDSGPERLALPPLPLCLEPPPDTPYQLSRAFREAFPDSYIPKNGPPGEIGLTYSFSHKDAIIVCLDQYAGGQHRVNQGWLDEQLGGYGCPHVFVCGHEPAFPIRGSDSLGFFPEARDIFWESIKRAGVRIYLCGHEHFYNRSLITDDKGCGMWQVIAGTGGAPVKPTPGARTWGDGMTMEYHNEENHGYLVATVEGLTVNVKWKGLQDDEARILWKVFDDFSYTLCEGPGERQTAI